MKRANYTPWNITAQDYMPDLSNMEKLRLFAGYAILAPSGHNTQPWQFKFDDDQLLLQISPSRDLPFSGELAAEPYVSLGACLETLSLAARGFGHELVTHYLFKDENIASIQLGAAITPEPALLDAISGRVSNRSFYKNEKIPPATMEGLLLKDFPKVSSFSFEDRPAIDYLARQTYEATAKLMTEPAFRSELSKWVRNNFTKQHDGMPGFVQGMPAPPSLLARHIVKRIDISKTQAKTDAARVAHTPAIVLLCAHDNTPEAFFDIGRYYSWICVRARQQGIDSSGVGAAVIDPAVKAEIARHFGLKYHPTALIRLGYATKPARHTPRWPVSQVIVD